MRVAGWAHQRVKIFDNGRLVRIDEILVVVVEQTVIKGILLDVAAPGQLIIDRLDQPGNFVALRPHVRLKLREHEHVIDIYLESSKPRV